MRNLILATLLCAATVLGQQTKPRENQISGKGTGVDTALGINIGASGSFITNGGAGGTPSSINLTNSITDRIRDSSSLLAFDVDGRTIYGGDGTTAVFLWGSSFFRVNNLTTSFYGPTIFYNYVSFAAAYFAMFDYPPPSTPGSTQYFMWTDSTDKRFHDKNDAGVVGTTVVADTGASNNFVTAISAAGVISKARPTFANLASTPTTLSGYGITDALPTTAIDDTAYDATTWNGDTTHAPSKNAVRDKIETLGGGGTVTATGGSLTSDAVVLGAGTVDTKVVSGITTDGATQLNLGTNSGTSGKVKLFGGTSGAVTITPQAAAGTAVNVTLPNTSSTLPIFSQLITFNGPTTSRTVTFPDANFTVARTDAANTFTGHQTIEGVTSTGATGTGKFVFDAAPTLGSAVLTTPVINGTATGTGVSSSPTASIMPMWDANRNLSADNFISGLASTVTAAGTTTLDVNSTFQQSFTGSSTQSVTLPAVNTLTTGHQFLIDNSSSGLVTVNAAAGSATVLIMAGGTDATFTCINPAGGNVAASWDIDYLAITAASGKKLTVSNSLTLAGTDGQTMTFPTTSATIARTDAANTFTGHQTVEGVTSTGATGTGKFVFDTSPTLVTPLLGTPTSGTLTNCTGLPIAGLTASTSTALGVGSIELGHATDTTIARSGAGVATVEGVTIDTISAANTLTNKNVVPRTHSTASATSWTPDFDTYDQEEQTALAGNITAVNAPTFTGATNGSKRILRIKNNATPHTIGGWDTIYVVMGTTLPLTIAASKTIYLGMIYNGNTSKWDVVAVATEL